MKVLNLCFHPQLFLDGQNESFHKVRFGRGNCQIASSHKSARLLQIYFIGSFTAVELQEGNRKSTQLKMYWRLRVSHFKKANFDCVAAAVATSSSFLKTYHKSLLVARLHHLTVPNRLESLSTRQASKSQAKDKKKIDTTRNRSLI